LHESGDRQRTCLHEQVIMIPKQTIRGTSSCEPLGRLAEQHQERAAVFVVLEDALLVVPPGRRCDTACRGRGAAAAGPCSRRGKPLAVVRSAKSRCFPGGPLRCVAEAAPRGRRGRGSPCEGRDCHPQGTNLQKTRSDPYRRARARYERADVAKPTNHA
jgi:hypothetical protein